MHGWVKRYAAGAQRDGETTKAQERARASSLTKLCPTSEAINRWGGHDADAGGDCAEQVIWYFYSIAVVRTARVRAARRV